MLRLFSKKIHESKWLQRADAEKYPALFAEQILSGEPCDRVSGGYGAPGSVTNTVPVNGVLGEIKYLVKFRDLIVQALFFHWLLKGYAWE